MRFDDMIATVLAQAADRPDRQAARWRQLVDLLAQRRPDPGDPADAAAYVWLRETRPAIDPETRRQSARSLAGRAIDPALIAFFAEDTPAVAAPLLAGARLETDAWLALLPRLGPAARSLLRHREDLALEVRSALAAFGPSDFRIEGAVGDSQIRELVDRIERIVRLRRPRPPVPAASAGRRGLTGFCSGSRARRAARWSGRASPGPRVRASRASTARPRARSRKEARSATPASPSPATDRRAATGGCPAFPGSIRRAAPSGAIAAPPDGRVPTRSPVPPPGRCRQACSAPNSPRIRCASSSMSCARR